MKTAAYVLSFIGALAGLFGAFSWVPWVSEWRQRPEVYGRIVSFVISQTQTFRWQDYRTGKNDSVSGAGFCLGLSLTCLKRDLAIRSCSAYVSFPNDPVRHAGVPYVARTSCVTFAGGEKKYLRIPWEQDLALTTVLEKDRVNKRYAVFIASEVPPRTALSFETIELVFRDYGTLRCPVVFRAADIDPKTVYYDSSILFDRP